MILSETESKFHTLQHTDIQTLAFFTNISPRFPAFIFSVSNRITTKAKALNASWALFSCDTTSKGRFRKEWHSAKKAVLHTQDKLLLWSMMARGGRDVRPPGANPSINRITLIALSGIWEGDFVYLVKHLLNRYSEQASINRLTQSANRGHLASISLIPTSSAITFPSRTLSYF